MANFTVISVSLKLPFPESLARLKPAPLPPTDNTLPLLSLFILFQRFFSTMVTLLPLGIKTEKVGHTPTHFHLLFSKCSQLHVLPVCVLDIHFIFQLSKICCSNMYSPVKLKKMKDPIETGCAVMAL